MELRQFKSGCHLQMKPCNRNGYRVFSMPDRYGFPFVAPFQVWEIESAQQRCGGLLYASIKPVPTFACTTKV